MCLAAPGKTGSAPVQQLVDLDAESGSRQIRQRGSLRSMSNLTGSAALVIVLIRKWW